MTEKNTTNSMQKDVLASVTIVRDVIEDEDFEQEDTHLQKPFDVDRISIMIRQPTIDNLMKRLKSDPQEIDLRSEFQREAGLWSLKQKSRLIESLLLRIPLPAFYFDGTNDDKWLVVDGLQRLSVFDEFMGNKPTLALQGLEYLQEYEGFTYQMLPRKMQRRIEETQVTAYVIQPGTPPDVKFNIFKRINTGGLPLSAQEIRNALHQGQPARYLRELSKMEAFQKIFGAIDTSRQGDQEFVLRFVAFYLTDYQKYEPDMDDFLNNGMEKIASMSKSELEVCKMHFDLAMKRASELFGDKAFRKVYYQPDTGKIRRCPINRPLFDAWSHILSGMGEANYQKLLQKKSRLLKNFMQMLENDKRFVRSITTATGGADEVRVRFQKIEKLVAEVIDDDIETGAESFQVL